MRVVVGQLLPLIQSYPALVDGAFVIICWVAQQPPAFRRIGAGQASESCPVP
jgi:hypothetical protein